MCFSYCDVLSQVIGLLRHARTLDKASAELRAGIFLIEKELKEMISRRWPYIMLHHSLTSDGATVSWQAIRNWHKGLIGSRDKKSHDYNPYVEKPMSDIGYHFGIELINDEYEILIGRNLDQKGAHCKENEMNERALGVCFIGNFDEAPPPEEQWQKGLALVRGLISLLDIPIRFVVGHRDYAPYKSCPGKMFNIEKFRAGIMSLKEGIK